MTVNQLPCNDFRSLVNNNFNNFISQFSWWNKRYCSEISCLHDEIRASSWVVLIELLINFIQRNCDQIKSDFGGPFSKIFDEGFFEQIFETGRRGLRIIRWRHQQTSSSYCCHKSIMSPFFLSRALYFQRFSNWPIRMIILYWPIRVQKTYLCNHHLWVWNNLLYPRSNHVMWRTWRK